MYMYMWQVDLDCLSEAYRSEQRDYYLNTSAWAEVHPAQLLGPGTLVKSYDLNKVTLDELKVGGGYGTTCYSVCLRCRCCAKHAMWSRG
jgi:hypothetical protein